MMDQMISYGAKLKQLATVIADMPAVTCQGVTLTYGELHRRTNSLARGLALEGVTSGALVTVALPNGLDFVEACWAIWKLGATPQPISVRLPAPELKAIIELANPALVHGHPIAFLSWQPCQTMRPTCPTSPRQPPGAWRREAPPVAQN